MYAVWGFFVFDDEQQQLGELGERAGGRDGGKIESEAGEIEYSRDCLIEWKDMMNYGHVVCLWWSGRNLFVTTSNLE